jgi:hypothetical protein
MNSDVTVSGFRDFMEWTGTTGRKSTTNLEVLLNAASDFLERRTGRLITASASNTTRKFTTNGRAYVSIPDLRIGDSVTLQSTALTVDEGYWLVPSRQDADIAIGVQLRAFGLDYRGNPDWFDRNLDTNQYWANTGLPNDLVIVGLWGHTFTPPAWRMAIYALAGYYYQHADALFSGARATPDGFLLNLDSLPSEVRDLVNDWGLSDQVALA